MTERLTVREIAFHSMEAGVTGKLWELKDYRRFTGLVFLNLNLLVKGV